VVNCAVNSDINYPLERAAPGDGELCPAGVGTVRYYKLGLVDGPGNPETMMLAGYYLLLGAVCQTQPERDSYPRRERGHVLVHCRGGRSRSVALVARYLHKHQPARFSDLEVALAHIRRHRELAPDEWFETPKPMLFDAAKAAAA
jgi:hypothetical protein